MAHPTENGKARNTCAARAFNDHALGQPLSGVKNLNWERHGCIRGISVQVGQQRVVASTTVGKDND